MNPHYRKRIADLADSTKAALAGAQNDVQIVAVQNEFNNRLNEIRADAKARPDGPPQRATPPRKTFAAPQADDPTPQAETELGDETKP